MSNLQSDQQISNRTKSEKGFITYSVDFTASQTAQAIWTPATGRIFVITDIVISTSVAGAITIFDGTDDIVHRVMKGNLAINDHLNHAYSKPFPSSAKNNVLKYTTGANITGSLTVSGYEKILS